MFSRLITSLAGIAAIFVGYIILTESRAPVYGFSTPRSTGILFAIFGVALVLFAVLRKNVSKVKGSRDAAK